MLNYLTQAHQILVTFVHANASAIAYVLAGYAIISLLNLFLGRKTQVEAWVAQHPNWALLLRTARGYGLDPWVLAKGAREYASHELIKQGPVLVRLLAAALRVAFRLPMLVFVALGEMTVIEQLKRLFLLMMVPVMLTTQITGCAWWQENKKDVKSVVQTVDEIAQNLCGVFYGDKLSLSVSDAIKTYCDTRDKYSPWIDQVLAGAKAGGDAKLGFSPATPVSATTTSVSGDLSAAKPDEPASVSPAPATTSQPIAPAASTACPQMASPTAVQATAPPSVTPKTETTAKGKAGAK